MDWRGKGQLVDGIQPSGAKIQTQRNVRGIKRPREDILNWNVLTKATELKLEKEAMPSNFQDRDALGLTCRTLGRVVVEFYRSQV